MSLTSIPKKIPFPFLLQQHTRLTTPPHPTPTSWLKLQNLLVTFLNLLKLIQGPMHVLILLTGTPDVHYTYSISMHVYLLPSTFFFTNVKKLAYIIHLLLQYYRHAIMYYSLVLSRWSWS